MNVITPRGIEIDPAAARPIDAIKVARQMLRTTRVAGFATLDPGGYPYVTATNLLVDAGGAPVIFMAGLSLHARNVAGDPRVSLVLADHGTDVMTTPRLTLSGYAVPVNATERAALDARYAARFPKSKLYLSLPDALLYRIAVQAVQLNGGPGRNANAVTPQDLATDISGAEALLAGGVELIAALNARGAADDLARAVDAPTARWTVAAVDPDGIDLESASQSARIWFDAPVTDPAGAEAAIAALLKRSVA